MAVRLVLPWVPWLVAEAALGYVEARLWPEGGLWLIVLWTVVLVLYRTALAATDRRTVRLAGDLFFAGICVVSVFEGGWYVLPAVIAFAACDAAGLTIHLPALPADRDAHELGAALAATVVGWLGLAIAVSGPLYETATSGVGPNGPFDIPPQVGLLQAGMSPAMAGLLVAIAVLFGLLPLAAAIHVRAPWRAAWLVLVILALALTILALPAVHLVGLWTAPGLMLTWLAVRVGRPVPSAARN